jgi:Spy/CpxP family protein refolding chaperone
MKNWKAIVGVIAVFLLGGLAGSFTTIAIVRHRLVRGHGSQMMADLIVRRLSWELRLDRAQRAQLRVIVHEGQQEMKPVRRQIQPQIEDILTRSEAKLRAVLRPDQQEKFDKLIAERKARWAQSKDG